MIPVNMVSWVFSGQGRFPGLPRTVRIDGEGKFRILIRENLNYFTEELNFAIRKKGISMLIIDSKDCENIDKALKKYKKKFERAKILMQLRERQSFTKPSIKRRGEVLKAAYRQQMANGKFEK
jgi:small subunit ribosomal protein S21